MKHLFQTTFTLLLCLIILLSANAQDVKNVDVKTLPKSDIQKAQKAMQDAGLSTQDAANIARQKGATEQQIQDFENRIGEGETGDQVISDPLEDAAEDVKEQQDVEKSTRQTGFNVSNRVFGSYLFKGQILKKRYKADFICYNKIIIELKP